MLRRILVGPQRIPMVEAGTLNDRTRPPAAPPAAPIKLRLSALGRPASSDGMGVLREKRLEHAGHARRAAQALQRQSN